MTELSLRILKSGLVFVTINLKDLASAPTVSYIDPVRALYAHHFLACEQALLFGRAKRVSRERAS